MASITRDYSTYQLPPGIPGVVPETAVPAGDEIVISCPLKPEAHLIFNTGPADLRVAFADGAIARGVSFPLPSGGAPLELAGALAAARIYIGCLGAADGEVAILVAYSRDAAGLPLEDAADAPIYDGSDTSSIIPGVR